MGHSTRAGLDSIVGNGNGSRDNASEGFEEPMVNRNEKTGAAILSADDSMYEPQRNEQALRCPDCGEATGLHIDGVVVENTSGQKLQVDAIDEDSAARLDVRLENDADHKGRRHQISLVGEGSEDDLYGN